MEELSTNRSSYTILLVDDDTICRKICRRQLEKMGHRVITACNGEEALALLCRTETPLDVALIDVQMPSYKGWELARAIREGQGGELHRQMPMVALTAFVSPQEEESCYQAGMRAVQLKPLRMSALHRTLERWVAA
jgi:CheY-like chemotaxis protein